MCRYMKKLEKVAEKKLCGNTALEEQFLRVQKREIFEIFADMMFKEHEKKNKHLAKEETKEKIRKNLKLVYELRR